MKKAVLICLYLGLAIFVLTACYGNKPEESGRTSVTDPASITTTETLAQQFIDITTKEELITIVDRIHAVLYDHDNGQFSFVDELTSWDFFNFFGNNFRANSGQWYNRHDHNYYIPLNEIMDVIDQYFEDYTFDPHQISTDKDVYNAEKKAITVAAYGVSGNHSFEIENIKEISGDEVEIDTVYYDRIENPASTEILHKMRLTLKIKDEGYRYLSYKKLGNEQPAYSNEKIEEIIENALLRGSNTNLLHAMMFNTDEDSETRDGYRTIKMEDDPGLISYPGYQDLIREIKNNDDIQQYFYDTFTKDIAQKYVNGIFEYKKYKVIEGKLYVNINIGTTPFVMADWKAKPYIVVENTPNRLTVTLNVQFFNSGFVEKHPLTIIKSEDKWLLTDSYIVSGSRNMSDWL